MHASRSLAGLAAAAVVGLSGCGRSLMPTPALYYDAEEAPFASVPARRQSNVVEILYATDRAPLDDEDPAATYGALRSTSLAFGRARVRIGPPDLAWDELTTESLSRHRSRRLGLEYLDADELWRLPRWPWYVNLADDPSLTEADVARVEADVVEEIHAILARELATTDRKAVYVFVHGFNNTFEYAAISLAELWHFAGRPGAAVLYSWPAARAGIFGYNPDRESSEFTVSHLKQFLRMLASCDAVERIHVLAHSRGTDILGAALRELYIQDDARGLDAAAELKLGNVVFAAADIDVEVASQRLGGENAIAATERLTVYTGAGDQALKLSARIFKSEGRIGQAGPEAVKDYQRYTLHRFGDRFCVIHRPRKSGLLGHGYYLSDPGVSSDLILLLRDDLPPGAAHGRPLRRDPSGMWIMPDDYPWVETEDAASR